MTWEVCHMRCYLALVDQVCEFDPLQHHPKLQCGPRFLPHLGGGGGDRVVCVFRPPVKDELLLSMRYQSLVLTL
jgi:hypothetical protein